MFSHFVDRMILQENPQIKALAPKSAAETHRA